MFFFVPPPSWPQRLNLSAGRGARLAKSIKRTLRCPSGKTILTAASRYSSSSLLQVQLAGTHSIAGAWQPLHLSITALSRFGSDHAHGHDRVRVQESSTSSLLSCWHRKVPHRCPPFIWPTSAKWKVSRSSSTCLASMNAPHSIFRLTVMIASSLWCIYKQPQDSNRCQVGLVSLHPNQQP